MSDSNRYVRWRLLLGQQADADLQQLARAQGALGPGEALLDAEQTATDEALGMLYSPGADAASSELSRREWERRPGTRHGSVKGRTMPRVATWLHEIRRLFPTDVVAFMQKDAIERCGLKELLFEPETLSQVEPSIDMVGMLLEMKNLVPEKAKDAAREIVKRVVEDLQRRLRSKLEQAVRGSLDRSRHSPIRSLPNMDWARTIRRNLKHYDPKLKTIIPEQFFFWSRQQRRNQWNVIIAMDQSGSMASSLIYGGIMGAILASMPAIETHLVAFNHCDVVDLTEHCSDPVDLLYGTQLGGAEDYWMATCYCEKLMHTPRQTLYILLADLYDTSPNEAKFVRKMEQLVRDGVKAIGLLAISDHGMPSYNENLAKKLANLGMPCFGCTPDHLPELLEATLKGQDLGRFTERMKEGK